MRVVGGDLGGRKLLGPPTEATRPTTDLVREAVFNSLNALIDIEEISVLDLFAGTGALGIEALSRGAARATFVENDRKALAVLKENLDTLGLSSQSSVVKGDAASYAKTGNSYDLALIDPPYKFEGWANLLTGLKARLVVAESKYNLPEVEGWSIIRFKKYGTTTVTYLETSRFPRANNYLESD